MDTAQWGIPDAISEMIGQNLVLETTCYPLVTAMKEAGASRWSPEVLCYGALKQKGR